MTNGSRGLELHQRISSSRRFVYICDCSSDNMNSIDNYQNMSESSIFSLEDSLMDDMGKLVKKMSIFISLSDQLAAIRRKGAKKPPTKSKGFTSFSFDKNWGSSMNSTMESASDRSGLRVSSFDKMNRAEHNDTTIKGSPDGKENQILKDQLPYKKNGDDRISHDLLEEDVHLEERPNISQTPTELRLHSALGGSILEENDKSPSPAPGFNSRSNLSYTSLHSQPVNYEEAHSNMSQQPYQEPLKESLRQGETPVCVEKEESTSIPKHSRSRLDRMQSPTEKTLPYEYETRAPERPAVSRGPSNNDEKGRPASKKESLNSALDQNRYVSIRTQPSAILASPVDQHDSIRTSLSTATGPETPVEFKFPPKLQNSHPGDTRDPSLTTGEFNRPASALSTREDYDARLAILEAEIEHLKLQRERSSSYLVSTPMRTHTMESDLSSVDESTAYSDYADETVKEAELDKERPLNYHKSVYEALGMGEIDALSLTEAQNRLKVITEAFKEIPFSKLMKIIPRIGKYMSEDDVCFNFASEIHEVIYDGRPLQRSRNGDINKECLTEMVEATQTMKICQDSVNEVLLNYMKK